MLTLEDLKFFLMIPVVLSGCCYLMASVIARLSSSVPRRIYIRRLFLMFVFVVVWWAYYLPYGSRAYVGDGNDGTAQWKFVRKNHGAFYGAHSIWAWCIVALVNRPRRQTHDTRQS